MGFFKKIGNAIKKGVKQISLKNVVKLGTPLLSMIPVVGGLAQNVVSGISESHELKKQAQQAEAEGKIAEAQALKQQADFLAAQSGAQVGQVAGTTFKVFTKGAADEALANINQSTKEVVAAAGVTVVDATINGWFKKHWSKLAIGIASLLAVFFIWKNMGNKNNRSTKYRR
jgi:hypothetical protein